MFDRRKTPAAMAMNDRVKNARDKADGNLFVHVLGNANLKLPFGGRPFGLRFRCSQGHHEPVPYSSSPVGFRYTSPWNRVGGHIVMSH